MTLAALEAPAKVVSIGGLIDEGARALIAAGIESARLDARLLMAHVLGADMAALIRDARDPISPGADAAFHEALMRRRRGEPVSRIVGTREFYGRDFAISPAVLDPRPDTEALVALALEFLGQQCGAPVRILDLGTGSGAILVTLLAEMPEAFGVGIDIDPAAVVVARANSARHGVADRAAFCACDWSGPIDGVFDLVVANPPYVARGEILGLAAEVRDHDPRCALDGGVDGLDCYRALAAGTGRLLAPGAGTLLVEIGSAQSAAVAALLAGHGFAIDPATDVVRDLAGCDRVVRARMRP